MGMGFDPRYTVSVNVLSPTMVPSKYSSELVPSWESPTSRRVDNVLVYVTESIESATIATPFRLDEMMVALFPYGDPVTDDDRVEVLSGRYAGTYGVDGTPRDWRTPWTGWEAGTEVRLKERTGA